MDVINTEDIAFEFNYVSPMVSVKMPPGKKPPRKMPRENCPPEISPQENCPPENSSTRFLLLLTSYSSPFSNFL